VLPTTYDALFRKHAGRIPVAFARALVKSESGFNPADTSGPAWGLMQIIEPVRSEYPSLAPSRSHLLDPEINAKIGLSLLNRIVAGYQKHGDRNMKEDWSNPEFVKLVLAGWNSGYSEGGGVGKVASFLESRGMPVTHDNVFAFASAAGATTQLQKVDKKNWQAGVANLYFQQPDAGQVASGNFLIKVGLAVLVGYGLSRFVFK
jgi:soluble lytic murein transglycosylase-like protein